MVDRLGRSPGVRVVAYGLFAGYVGLVVVAGAWGAFGPARVDHRWLFDLDTSELEATTAASLLSQYRFLRAIELGFGLCAARYWRQIFADGRFGRPFLVVMTLGVVARLAGWIWAGRPSPLFFFFLATEAFGAATIWLVARTLWSAAPAR